MATAVILKHQNLYQVPQLLYNKIQSSTKTFSMV